MDAPAPSSERQRELATLRSRAYGPDADIDRDTHALARLVELEELARAEALEPASVEEPHPISGVATTKPAHSAGGSTQTAVIEGAAEAAPNASGAEMRRPGWRRVPLWAYIAGALVVGLVVGLVVPTLLPPHPVTTLQQAPIEGAVLDFQMYGIQADAPIRYQPFHDLEVWSARTEQGSTCIVVTTAAAEWMAAGCAPEPLNPTADITFYSGMRPIDGLELPNGSVVRLTLRDDVIEVWIAETLEGA
jgi:hypothetical protein